MSDESTMVNIKVDTEMRMMLDSMVTEAPYETDRSKFIRGLIKKEFARQHPEVKKIEELPRPDDSSHVIPVLTMGE
jgi:hypothetical protein